MRKSQGLMLILMFCMLTCSFAQTDSATNQATTDLVIKKDKIYDPSKLSLDSVRDYEKNFTYEWWRFATLKANQNKIKQIEEFLQTTPPDEFKKLSKDFREALGRILYKLGTYYTHYQKAPNRAIRYLKAANNYLTKPIDRAWNYNHLAYAYEQRFAKTDDEVDQKQAVFFANKAMQYAGKKTSAAAFNFCVRALLEKNVENTKQAQSFYQTALNLYRNAPSISDQYQRARTEYAAILLANDENDAALSLLLDVKNYWQKRGERLNLFAAKNLLVLGETYLKLGKPDIAQKAIKQAVNVYEKVYGKDNEMLMYPYQLLADAYKILGNQSLADTYQIQANSLDKS